MSGCRASMPTAACARPRHPAGILVRRSPGGGRRTTARFSNHWKRLLEQPALMLAEAG
ncbi:MAG: hypothetical protein U5L11_06830 [Arhodomonas sp.]|nr:hypothetical protein [Arhodomonas sp.]